MSKLFYPALFHKAEEGGFWISFPDIPECLTQGDDMAQAYEMADLPRKRTAATSFCF